MTQSATQSVTNAGYSRLDDRGVLALSGPEHRDFLQGLVSNDIDRLDPDRALYAGLLTPQGKFLHDFLLAARGDVILLDCEGARREDLLRRLTMYRLRRKVTIEDLTEDWSVTAVFGPGSETAFALGREPGQTVPSGDGVAFVDPRLPALGVRLLMPSDQAAATLSGLGLEARDRAAYDAHRLALGVPDGSRDIEVDRSFLLESNFEELNGVDFDKGCYVGQENTARQKHRGSVRKRLMPVAIEGPVPEPGTPVLAGEKKAGTMRSGRGKTGLALLRLEYLDAGATDLRAGAAVLTPRKPAWAESAPIDGPADAPVNAPADS